jgi:5-bromo-4-chloroindolyl phosphate hydrolysis protein
MKMYDMREYKYAKVFKKDLAEIRNDLAKVQNELDKWRKYKEVKRILTQIEMSDTILKMHQEHYDLVLKDKGRVT